MTGNIILEGATLNHARSAAPPSTPATDIAANYVALKDAKFGDRASLEAGRNVWLSYADLTRADFVGVGARQG